MKLRKLMVLIAIVGLVGALLQGCGGKSGDKSDSGTAAENTKKDDGAKSGDQSKDQNKDQSKDNNAGTGGKVTLKVWGDLPNQAVLEEPYKKINAAFEAKNPNIKIQYDFAQNDQSLNVALQANELPDLFFVQGNKTPKMAEMIKNGFLLDLNPYKLDTSRYADTEVAYGTVDGKLYSSLPAFFDYNLVYYNKDLFEKNGVAVPKTWDEFVTLLDTLKGKGITPIALPGKSEWDRAWPTFTLAADFANESLKAVAEGKGKLTDPGIAAMLQMFRDMVEKGYFGKDYLGQDLAAAQFAFTNSKAAMIIDGTWNNPTYESSGVKLGRFALPNKDGKRVVQGGYSNFMTYAVSAKTQHPQEAFEYIKFLSSQEAQQIMEDSTGAVPTLKDIKPKNEAVQELANFDSVGSNIYTVLSGLVSPESNTPDVLMKEVIPKLMTSEITGEQAAGILDKAAKYK